jgi:uroporphyrinogen-III synthase
MIKLLSTKQLSKENLAYAKAFNFEVTCIDFIEITPVLWRESDLKNLDCDTVAFTSSSGVKYFFANPAAREWIKGKDIFAVAGKTANELDRQGMSPVMSAVDALTLTEGVISKNKYHCVVHVCGNLRLDTLETKVRQGGIQYHPLVVYNTRLLTNIQLKEEFDAILFFSPSGVEGFLAANKINEKTVCCCIGKTTAAALRETVSCAKVVISPFPSPKSMIERAAKYFETRSTETSE